MFLSKDTSTLRISISLFLCCVLLNSCANDSWKVSVEAAEKFKKSGDIEQSIKHYALAINEMERAHADKDAELQVLAELISLQTKAQKYKEASVNVDKAISLAELSYGPNDYRLMPFLTQARVLSSRLSDRPRGSALLERMISLEEKKNGRDSIQMMWILDEYARSTSPSCGDMFDKTKLKQLVLLREKFSSDKELETLQDKFILADVLAQTNEKDEAEKLYLASIESARANVPGILANGLVRYSRFLIKNGREKEAIPLLREAYLMAGPGPHYNPLLGPEIADELGGILENEGKKQEAATVYSAIIAKLNESMGTHPMLETFSNRYKELAPTR